MSITYSAGSSTSYICTICDPDGDGQYVATQETSTPHPVFTNEKGDAVVQLQLVTIGGPNGLNA